MNVCRRKLEIIFNVAYESIIIYYIAIKTKFIAKRKNDDDYDETARGREEKNYYNKNKVIEKICIYFYVGECATVKLCLRLCVRVQVYLYRRIIFVDKMDHEKHIYNPYFEEIKTMDKFIQLIE